MGEGEIEGQLDEAIHDTNPLLDVRLVLPQVGQIHALGVGTLSVLGQE